MQPYITKQRMWNMSNALVQPEILLTHDIFMIWSGDYAR